MLYSQHVALTNLLWSARVHVHGRGKGMTVAVKSLRLIYAYQPKINLNRFQWISSCEASLMMKKSLEQMEPLTRPHTVQ